MYVRALDWTNRKGKSFAVRVRGVHPKHLVEVPGHAWYLEHIPFRANVLDVGSGTGAHAKRIYQIRLAHVVEIDKRFGHDADQPWITCVDNSFDIVMMLDVLEHLHHRHQALSEAHRVLKRGGKLLLAVPNRLTAWRQRLRDAGLFSYSDPDHKWEYTSMEIYDDITAAGFRVTSMSPAVYDTPWAGMQDAIGSLYLPLYRYFATRRHQHNLRNTTGYRIVGVK